MIGIMLKHCKTDPQVNFDQLLDYRDFSNFSSIPII